MTRQEANHEIIKRISDVVEQYPNWRFHQILQNLSIVHPGKDRWYEESVDTLDNIKEKLI